MLKTILKTTTVALMLTAASGAARAEEWICSGYMPSVEHPSIVALQAVADELTRLTDGEITASCKTGGELSISPTELVAATSDGVIQLASNPFITGSVPITGIFALPGLFSTEEEFDKGLAIAEPSIIAGLEAQGLVYLGAYRYPRQVIFTTKELTSLADMAGRKIRVSAGEQAEFVTRYGGTPVTIATPDVAPALQLGTIDGVLSAASGAARYWTDALKSNYELGPNYTLSLMFINADSFGSLTPEQQDQLRAFAKDQIAGISPRMTEENVALTAQFATEGMTVTPAKPEDEAALVADMADYWPKWAEDRGPEAVALLAEIRSAIGK